MALKDLVSGTEVQSQALDDNFNTLETKLLSVEGTVVTVNAKFDASLGHRHRATSGDAPKVDHGDLAGLTDNDHTQYALNDSTARPMSTLIVAGPATARRLTVRPIVDMHATPILEVIDNNGNHVMDVISDSGASPAHSIKLPGLAGTKLGCISYLTFAFDMITPPGEPYNIDTFQRVVKLPNHSSLGSMAGYVAYIHGYAYKVGEGTSDLIIDVSETLGGGATPIGPTLIGTLTFPHGVNEVEDAVELNPLYKMTAGNNMLVSASQVPEAMSLQVSVSVALLTEYK